MRRASCLAGLTAAVVASTPMPATASTARSEPVWHVRGSDQGTFSTEAVGPGVVHTTDVAVGHATHLGRYTLRASEDIDLTTGAVSNGTYTMTAANGARLSGTYEGTAAATTDPLVMTYHVVGPVTGGTGRFEGARGRLTFDGTADLGAGTLSDRVTGLVRRTGDVARRPRPW
jgi:hypothetical protein